jgi:hypothetical protein
LTCLPTTRSGRFFDFVTVLCCTETRKARRRDEVSVEARLKLPEADVIDGPLAQHHSSRNSEKSGAEAGPRVPIRTPSIDGAIASSSR